MYTRRFCDRTRLYNQATVVHETVKWRESECRDTCTGASLTVRRSPLVFRGSSLVRRAFQVVFFVHRYRRRQQIIHDGEANVLATALQATDYS